MAKKAVPPQRNANAPLKQVSSKSVSSKAGSKEQKKKNDSSKKQDKRGPTGDVGSSSDAKLDIGDIFAAAKQRKSTSNQPAQQQQQQQQPPQQLTRQAYDRPVKDGLYHDKEVDMRMSDEAFFNGGKTASGPQRVVDGLRVVLLDEMKRRARKMRVSGNSPNCPFDCDCCF